MKILFLTFGPFVCYFVLLFYAGFNSTVFGIDWVRSKDHLLFEYLIILLWYYQLGLFSIILIKLKK